MDWLPTDLPTEIGGLDVLKYIGLLRRRGPLVAAFGVLGGLLGAIYALQLIPSLYGNGDAAHRSQSVEHPVT